MGLGDFETQWGLIRACRRPPWPYRFTPPLMRRRYRRLRVRVLLPTPVHDTELSRWAWL